MRKEITFEKYLEENFGGIKLDEGNYLRALEDFVMSFEKIPEEFNRRDFYNLAKEFYKQQGYKIKENSPIDIIEKNNKSYFLNITLIPGNILRVTVGKLFLD